jgi:hypothetical protein
LSSTTLRPFGPSVTLTALLRMSTPRSILSRASVENLTSFADIAISWVLGRGFDVVSGGLLGSDGAFNHAHDVGLLHDQEIPGRREGPARRNAVASLFKWLDLVDR